MSGPAHSQPNDDRNRTPALTARMRWLVSCSADRTLIARRVDSERTELVKIFETGSFEDARHELDLAQQLTSDGLAKPHSVLTDPETGRPCLVLDYLEGENLAEFVTRRGALSPRNAARVIAEVARIVAGLHETCHYVHRDLKPSNILLGGAPVDVEHGRVWLLDFEHVMPIATGPRSRASRMFTGGSHGYAPPEAYAGAIPTTAFDVFALGALLWFTVTGEPAYAGRDPNELAKSVRDGRRSTRLLAGAADEVVSLITRCLEQDPATRPSAREVAKALAAFSEDPELDGIWHAIRSADLERAATELATVTRSPRPVSPRMVTLQQLLHRRQRLLRRVAPPNVALDARTTLETRAIRVTKQVGPVAAFLFRFPQHRPTLAMRMRMRREAARLIHEVPFFVAEEKRAARHREAESTVIAIHQALLATTRFPGAAPLLVGGAFEPVPTPRLRDPLRFLTLLLDDLQQERKEHEAMIARLHEREASLDLLGVDAAIHELQELRTGASAVVAELKDRTHRLGFYVERLAHSDDALKQLSRQLENEGLEIDLGAAMGLRALCASRIGADTTKPSRSSGTARSVLRSLQDLVAEFPQTAGIALPAAGVIESALDALTDAAWTKLHDAEKKLEAVPIPIRPLQALVHRIDGMRLADLLTDRPQGTQAELLDDLERLRLQVDQARTARDRITRSAQDSLDRGHITTALFDMQRAADKFTSDGEDSKEAARALAENLEDARRRRKDFDAAATRNLNLAARYSALLDDPGSARDDRIKILEQRREALMHLLENGPIERGGAWQQDLGNVRVSLLQERSDRGDEELERIDDLDERLAICDRLLGEFETATAEPRFQASLGRVQRLCARWSQHRERVLADLATRRTTHRRSNLLRLVRAGVLFGLLFGVFEVARGMQRGDSRALAITALERATDLDAVVAACERLGAPASALTQLRAGVTSARELEAWSTSLSAEDSERVRIAVKRVVNR